MASRETRELLAALAEHNAQTKQQEQNAYDNLLRVDDPVEGPVSVKDTAKIGRILRRTKNG